MRNPLLLAALLVAACGQKTRTAETPGKAHAPRFGHIVAIWAVHEDASGKRLGFVEKTSYDDGRMIYWVNNDDRSERLGYILSNNHGYQYYWTAGSRTAQTRSIGADTITANARRILGHARPVRLEQIQLTDLLPKRRQQAAPAGEEKAADSGDE